MNHFVSAEIYNQLCTSYKGIDDFRATLLGALPLATGAGILFTAKEASPLLQHAWAIAIFGILITLGLFCYEIYGITKCTALILTGTKIELAAEGYEISAEKKSEILNKKLDPAEADRIFGDIAENVPGSSLPVRRKPGNISTSLSRLESYIRLCWHPGRLCCFLEGTELVLSFLPTHGLPQGLSLPLGFGLLSTTTEN